MIFGLGKMLRVAVAALVLSFAGTGCREPQFSGGELPELEQGTLAVLQTELSPATLFHVGASDVSFFSQMAQYGLGGPTFSAYSAVAGPTVVARGNPFETETMIENWILVWFAGAEGWTNWDVPMALFLERKPSEVRLDDEGLHLSFPGPGGTIAMLPLYGYRKMPQRGVDIPVKTERRGHKLLPYGWEDFLPRDVLIRLRYWASATREFPVHCQETFRLDPASETLTIRQEFRWLSIPDEWNTKPLKLAPVSPSIALAHSEAKFPVRFGRRSVDMDMPTPFGPTTGVQDASSYEMTFPLLGFVHRTETADLPSRGDQNIARELEQARRAALSLVRRAGELAPADLVLLARALPHLDERSRAEVVRVLTHRFENFIAGATPDAAHASSDGAILEAIWAMSHFSGDWSFATTHWPSIRSRFSLGRDNRWAAFGCEHRRSIALQAGPALAMARMAFRLGDTETYHYACYLFIRELAHLAIQLRAKDYFKAHHPWHSMEPPPEPVFITQVTEAGWQLSPSRTERLEDLVHRWAGFSDPDIARFLREHAPAALRADLDHLEAALETENSPAQTSGSSLLLLRSLLRNESFDALAAKREMPEEQNDSRALADALGLLRAASTTQVTVLISPQGSSPFAIGAERDAKSPRPELIQAVESTASGATDGAVTFWPRVNWLNWRTPSGDAWNFGHVTAGQESRPAMEVLTLNWNSRVIRARDLSGEN
jgi:hypothetical protein